MSKSQLAMSPGGPLTSDTSAIELGDESMRAETHGMFMCERLSVAWWWVYRVAKNT